MSVRGYADWKPKPEAAHWVRCAREVGEEYRAEWPLTVRQIFYRLVAVAEYPKTEGDYTKLTGLLSRARRAGMLPWEMIRDGGQGKGLGVFFYEGAEDFVQSVKDSAEAFRLDRQDGQDKVIELWCEAGGMTPILSQIARPYGCRVNSGGGYDSVTSKHQLAGRVRRRAEEGLRTLILHVGDFDGSGEDMCNVLREDTMYMVVSQVAQAAREATRGLSAGNWPTWIPRDRGFDFGDPGDSVINWTLDFFAVERVALTGDQVVDREVITAPPKKSDARTKEFLRRNHAIVEALGTENISAQLEALTPPELRGLLSEQIEAHLDMGQYRAVREREQEIRDDVMERVSGVE